MLPIDYANNITPIVIGDGYYNSGQNHLQIVNQHILDRINNASGERLSNDHLFITSFADRPNTGKQPVGDDVMVDVNLDTAGWHISEYPRLCCWGENTSITEWKPNHDTMLKQYQPEQLKVTTKTYSVSPAGCAPDVQVTELIPAFTQEMHTNNIAPPVGSKFKIEDIGKNSRILDFLNKEVEVIGLSKSTIGADIITFQHPTIGIGCGVYHSVWVKPIQTAEDKLRGHLWYAINGNESKESNIDAIISDLMASPEFTITLKG